MFCRHGFRRILYHQVRAYFDAFPLRGSCQGSIGPNIIWPCNSFSDRVVHRFGVMTLRTEGSEDVPNVRLTVLYAGLLLVICCKCEKTTYVQCDSKGSGIFWTCPHCKSMRYQEGKPCELSFFGEASDCSNTNCQRKVWIRRFRDKYIDVGVTVGFCLTATALGGVNLFSNSPSGAVEVAGQVFSGTAGAWNGCMGVATQVEWRACHGTLQFIVAGLDLAGDKVPAGIGRGLNVLQVVAHSSWNRFKRMMKFH